MRQLVKDDSKIKEFLFYGISDNLYINSSYKKESVLFHKLSIFFFLRNYSTYSVYVSSITNLDNLYKIELFSNFKFVNIYTGSGFINLKYILEITNYIQLEKFINIIKDNDNYIRVKLL